MDIGTSYADYLKSTVTSSSNLERTLNGTSKSSSEDELLDACKEFETYFYEQVFKNMEKAMVPKTDSGDYGTLVDYYKENLLSQYSKEIVEQSGDNSLAHQLYEQMKRNYGTTEIPNAEADSENVNAKEVAASATAVLEE